MSASPFVKATTPVLAALLIAALLTLFALLSPAHAAYPTSATIGSKSYSAS
jgi:stage II sporulation protein D